MRLIVFDDVMTAESAVSDADFRDILAATRHFVRAVIVPRESEIAEGDRIPDDIRDQA
jgi:acyl-CoA dehydrogenase